MKLTLACFTLAIIAISCDNNKKTEETQKK